MEIRCSENAVEQRRLRNVGTVVLIAVITMTPALSTDLYMPGLPTLTEELGASQTMASFTMTVFFICMAIGMLLAGPLSDKCGRKPILLCGVSVAACLSFACVFAQSIGALIAFRACQGLGAGGMMAMETALVKDCFEGKSRAVVLAVSQAISLVAPIVAPLLGVAVLQVFGWRGTFATLAILMSVALLGSLLLEETLPPEKRQQGGFAGSFQGLAIFARDQVFVGLLVAGGLLAAGHAGYINVSSYIYIDLFGVSEAAFGVLFALASLLSAAGAIFYMFVPGISVKKVLIVATFLITVCGVAFLAIGSSGPIVFMLCFLPIAFFSPFIRPMITNYLLNRVESNVGAAASVINFLNGVIGTGSMMVTSFGQDNFIVSMGLVTVVSAVFAGVILLVLIRKRCVD